ncbi:MAG: prolipoprotein diacylglyceryl transferase [Solobacterium sp.]|nr:prolipoprotein diacylglyceryl transferase [Solobacterium sp.]
MHNDWLTIGPVTIHGYGVMMALGILVGISVAEKMAKKYGLAYEKIENMIFVAILCGFLGAKINYILTVLPDFFANPLSVLGGGGWVVYGSIIGGLLGAYVYCRIQKWNFMQVLDTVIVALPLAQAIGRIGCFFAGCCYGKETNAWYGITFPQGSLSPAGIPLIPTQLIMSLGDLVIFFVLFYRIKKKGDVRNTGALYLILYSIGRFLIEFLRGDLERGHVGILSTSQFIGIFMCIFGIALWFYNNKKRTA